MRMIFSRVKGETMLRHTRLAGVAGFVLISAGIVFAGGRSDGVLPSSSGPSEPRWSRDETDTSPDGKVNFHGPFSNDTVRVDFANLPEHDFIEIDVDVLILRTWDGSVPWEIGEKTHTGPDYFRISVPKGPMLLSTTFSCLPDNPPGFNEEGKKQNFPSPVPGDRLPAWGGAPLKNSMGYPSPSPGPPMLVPMDATYRLRLLLPHHESSLKLNLEALGLQSMLDESWGIGSLTAKPLMAKDVVAPDDTEIKEAFETAIDPMAPQLSVEKGGDPMAAVNLLVAGMGNTVAWIKKHVEPRPLDPDEVNKAIQDLAGDDDHIESRDLARRTLAGMGPAVEPYLRDARYTAHGEQHERIELVLQRLGVTHIDDDGLRRIAFATRILEVINTPEAMLLRRQLVEKTNP